MSLKKLCCMFAVGVFMMLFSVMAASACTHDHSALGSGEHVGDINHRVKSSTISSNPIGERKHVAIKDHSAKQPKSPIRANAAMTPVQDDDEPEFAGSCIHGNGCTCSGRRSHTRGCGTQGDCHAHSGLTCTWGGSVS
jgi:hypothetical protein